MARDLLNVDDFRHHARTRLPRGLFEYIDRGTEDENGLVRNRASFDRIGILPSYLENVSRRSLTTTILGEVRPVPLVVSPTALAGLVWHEGERAMARAACKLGIPVCMSTMSITPIERIASATSIAPWFQLYVWDDRALTYALLDRVCAAGVETLIVTVDGPVSGNREYKARNGFSFPFRPTMKALFDIACHPRWLCSVPPRGRIPRTGPTLPHFPADVGKILRTTASLTWKDISLLRTYWRGKLLLKGILDPHNAVHARRLGVDGIVVSNHGARNLDSTPASIDMLPEIVAEAGSAMTVLLDSGIRRGSDIFKALALGAQGVLAGRAPLWGLASGGEQGAYDVLALLGSGPINSLN